MSDSIRDQWKINAQFFCKSAAQVETLVSPQVVRPKSGGLKPKREKPYRLMGRFSKKERDDIQEKARKACLSVNEYIRAMALDKDYKHPNSSELAKALMKLGRELTAQGNNLNQIARHLNGGLVSLIEGEGLLGLISRSMLQTQKAICEALSRGKTPEL